MPPEDVGLVEILVADPFFVEPDGETGECFEHGQRIGGREPFRSRRERCVVRPAGYEIGLRYQPVATVFAPCDGFGRVDFQLAQAQGVFVGAPGLALAEKRVHDGIERAGPFVTLDHEPFASDVEGADLIAAVVKHFARHREKFRKLPDELPQVFHAGIDRNFHVRNLLAELNYKRFMFKKLCILLIFSKLNEIKHLIDKYRMHNLYAIFAKLLNICKQIAGNLVNESGNVPRRGVVPKFSDLEVVALNMASEAVGIDSESLLFANLQEYRVEIPNLISRRQYNDRRKITSSLCNAIRERMVAKMDGGEDYFCIDSKPIEVCRIARSKRCSMGKKDFSKAPGVGYCASQSMYYYGYKLHAVCGLSGVIHSFDLTKASVHDIHYLKDVKVDYSNCTVIGDRGYISAQVQLDLFETANIRLEVPYRCNQKEWKPTFPAFAKARKRIETLFSQLCDQFMIIRNYAKDTDGLFARIIGKISALTILQYINYKNEKPIGRVKYALF